jgi:hypothetical protein
MSFANLSFAGRPAELSISATAAGAGASQSLDQEGVFGECKREGARGSNSET